MIRGGGTFVRGAAIRVPLEVVRGAAGADAVGGLPVGRGSLGRGPVVGAGLVVGLPLGVKAGTG